MTIIYTLASNGSLAHFPANSLSRFVNVVPPSVQNELMRHPRTYARVRKVALSTGVEMPTLGRFYKRSIRHYETVLEKLGDELDYRQHVTMLPRDERALESAKRESVRRMAPQWEAANLARRVEERIFKKGMTPEEELTSADELALVPMRHHGLVQIQLGELDTSRLEGDAERCLGRFVVPAATPDESHSTTYHVEEFVHAPFIQLNHRPLTQLTIELLDGDGERLNIEDGGAATVVVLELVSEADGSFGMTCHSHNDYNLEVYDTNAINDFHVRLPHEMDLSDYEVGLSRIIFPPYLYPPAAARIEVTFPATDDYAGSRSYSFEYDLHDFKRSEWTTRSHLLSVLQESFGLFQQLRKFLRWSIYEGEVALVTQETDELPDYVYVRLNAQFWNLAGGGPTGPMEFEGYRQIEMGRIQRDARNAVVIGQIFGTETSQPDIAWGLRRAQKRSLAFVHCDAIESCPVNESQQQILAVMHTSAEVVSAHVLEPRNVVYRRARTGPLSQLHFSLRNDDGKLSDFEYKYEGKAGLAIELLFRPRRVGGGGGGDEDDI